MIIEEIKNKVNLKSQQDFLETKVKLFAAFSPLFINWEPHKTKSKSYFGLLFFQLGKIILKDDQGKNLGGKLKQIKGLKLLS